VTRAFSTSIHAAVDEAAFDHHAGLPHTVRFIEPVQALALIDHRSM
jgi:hypothetical protein